MGALLWNAVPSHAADSAETEPAVAIDPVEREFEGKLRELRGHQKEQTRELQARKDLTPEQRLDQRRALLSRHQKEVQALESQYQARLSPEARARWKERRDNRQKRFEKLHRTPAAKDSTKTSKSNRSTKPKAR